MAAETVTALVAKTPVELLRDLNLWMEAEEYGADHPWRTAIASTLATDPAAWLGMTAMSPQAPAKTEQRAEFFCLDCRYSIEPGATLPGLVHDGLALLASSVGVLEKLELDEDAAFAPLHLLRQAVAVIGVAAELSKAVEGRPHSVPRNANLVEPSAAAEHGRTPVPLAALRAAMDFVAVAQTMGTAMTSLLADLDTFGVPSLQGHTYGIEACLDKLAREAAETAEIVESALRHPEVARG